jgi:FkbM family methyltransferase
MSKILQWFGRQAYIPFGIRSRVVSKLVNSTSKESRPFTTRLNGYVYNGNFNTYIDWHVYYFGVYERGFLNFLKEVAIRNGADTVFCDIGANVGHHTLFMAPYCKKLLAYEPNPDSYQKVLEKINDNQLKNIDAFPFGLSNTNETLNFYVPEMTNTGAASFEDRSSWGHRKITATVRNGDEAIRETGIARLDIIKIDVEGFEKNVLEGLKETLGTFRPLVFFEMENNTIEKFSSEKELFDLFPTGYGFVKVGGGERRQAGIQPFSFLYDGANVLAYPEEKKRLING